MSGLIILVMDGLKNSGKMRELLRLIAFQMGNEVSYDELGKQLGMSKNTVENYLISERIKMSDNVVQVKEFYFWRTYDNQEIDLIEEYSGGVSAFEFKWGDKYPSAPVAFASAYPHATFDVVNRVNYLKYII